MNLVWQGASRPLLAAACLVLAEQESNNEDDDQKRTIDMGEDNETETTG